jgi:hypothetical protein
MTKTTLSYPNLLSDVANPMYTLQFTLGLYGPSFPMDLSERVIALASNIEEIDKASQDLKATKQIFVDMLASTRRTCEHDYNVPIQVSSGVWKRTCKACMIEQRNPSTLTVLSPVWEITEE